MKIYLAKKGDTLEHIARKQKKEVSQLAKLNPTYHRTETIAAGQKIILAKSSETEMNPIQEEMQIYIVKQGDSLWKLSKKWGLSLQQLIQLNPQLKNPNVLLTNETIFVPHFVSLEQQVDTLQTKECNHMSDTLNNGSPACLINASYGYSPVDEQMDYHKGWSDNSIPKQFASSNHFETEGHPTTAYVNSGYEYSHTTYPHVNTEKSSDLFPITWHSFSYSKVPEIPFPSPMHITQSHFNIPIAHVPPVPSNVQIDSSLPSIPLSVPYLNFGMNYCPEEMVVNFGCNPPSIASEVNPDSRPESKTKHTLECQEKAASHEVKVQFPDDFTALPLPSLVQLEQPLCAQQENPKMNCERTENDSPHPKTLSKRRNRQQKMKHAKSFPGIVKEKENTISKPDIDMTWKS